MELSLKDLKELLSNAPIKNDVWQPYPQAGTNVFIRTVTMAYTGRLVDVTANEIVLEEATWIADTGRFYDFLKTGKLNEAEPFLAGRVIIGRGSLIDLCEWQHALTREQK
jgi:hypothetical protein